MLIPLFISAFRRVRRSGHAWCRCYTAAMPHPLRHSTGRLDFVLSAVVRPSLAIGASGFSGMTGYETHAALTIPIRPAYHGSGAGQRPKRRRVLRSVRRCWGAEEIKGCSRPMRRHALGLLLILAPTAHPPARLPWPSPHLPRRLAGAAAREVPPTSTPLYVPGKSMLPLPQPLRFALHRRPLLAGLAAAGAGADAARRGAAVRAP